MKRKELETMLTPTRRLSPKERRVFERVAASFDHLQPSDAEQLTQYVEAIVRYEAASKSCKKNPTVLVPVINRTTGNQTGEKTVRNPAFATLKESQAAIVSLGRRLLIDAHSAAKRERLATKLARAATGQEQAEAERRKQWFTEKQIADKVQWLQQNTLLRGESALRHRAIYCLQFPATCPDDAEFEAVLIYRDDDGSLCPAPSAQAFLS